MGNSGNFPIGDWWLIVDNMAHTVFLTPTVILMRIFLNPRQSWLATLPLSLLTVSALAADASSTPAKTEAAAPKVTNHEKTQPVVDAHPVDVFELPDIEVVGNTPLGATGLELKRIPDFSRAYSNVNGALLVQ